MKNQGQAQGSALGGGDSPPSRRLSTARGPGPPSTSIPAVRGSGPPSSTSRCVQRYPPLESEVRPARPQRQREAATSSRYRYRKDEGGAGSAACPDICKTLIYSGRPMCHNHDSINVIDLFTCRIKSNHPYSATALHDGSDVARRHRAALVSRRSPSKLTVSH